MPEPEHPIIRLRMFNPNHEDWTSKKGITIFDATELSVMGRNKVVERWRSTLERWKRPDGTYPDRVTLAWADTLKGRGWAMIPARLEIQHEDLRILAHPEATPHSGGLEWVQSDPTERAPA